MPESASIERVGACVRRVEPLDFYFTPFADLGDGSRIDSDDEGRWYIDVELSDRDPEQRIAEAVRRELRDFGLEDRWSMLVSAAARRGVPLDAETLENATFVVELDESAQEWVRDTRGST